MTNRFLTKLKILAPLLLIVISVSCSSEQIDSNSSNSQVGVIPTPNTTQGTSSQSAQTKTTIDLDALENSLVLATSTIESLKASVSDFRVQFADLIVEYQYQIKCGSRDWPRWLVPQDTKDIRAYIIGSTSTISNAIETIITVPNEIDGCKTGNVSDYYILEHQDASQDRAWINFGDAGFQAVFTAYVPQLKNFYNTKSKAWDFNDPAFNSTYEQFQTAWANRFSERSSELKTKMNDFNIALQSKQQELANAQAELESITLARDAAVSMLTSTSSSSSIYVAPKTTVKPTPGSITPQSKIRAVSIMCQDGNSFSSGCAVTWSNGTRSYVRVGPRSGAIVNGTDFYDMLGNHICVDLYENGAARSYYC
jgi:hypothetical protein